MHLKEMLKFKNVDIMKKWIEKYKAFKNEQRKKWAQRYADLIIQQLEKSSSEWEFNYWYNQMEKNIGSPNQYNESLWYNYFQNY